MKELITKLQNTNSLELLEELRVEVLGKKGLLAKEFARLKDIPNKDKKEFAQNINSFKVEFNSAFEDKKTTLLSIEIDKKLKEERIDVSLFNSLDNSAAFHPVLETMDRIIDYFIALNFSLQEGPLVEDDFHNFEALNLPKFHPARDMQDTFYFKDQMMLRTHTSPVQIRTMQEVKPPIRIISPGRVFRRDFDLTHTPMFNQVEALVVDDVEKISFANLKYILEDFLKYMFGDVKVRFRPSFFPFTEPSAEADISCVFCEGEGCRVCSHTGWLEVLGCGLVDENVYKAVGYEKVSGYAFGLGVERFAMLIHRVSDLRSLFESDIKLLEQFRK